MYLVINLGNHNNITNKSQCLVCMYVLYVCIVFFIMRSKHRLINKLRNQFAHERKRKDDQKSLAFKPVTK